MQSQMLTPFAIFQCKWTFVDDLNQTCNFVGFDGLYFEKEKRKLCSFDIFIILVFVKMIYEMFM